MATATRALSGTAFATLLLVALMMGANHVAARVAFNNGVDVATGVAFALVLAWLVLGQTIAPVQVAGALLVVGAVVVLALRKR